MIYIFRCPPVNNLIVTEEEPYQVAGVYPKIMQEGTMDAGAWSCGMVAGLIHDVPTCKELIDRIIQEAEDIINRQTALIKTA